MSSIHLHQASPSAPRAASAAGRGLRIAAVALGTLCAAAGLHAQNNTAPANPAPTVDPRSSSDPGTGLGPSGGAIAPGSVGTRSPAMPPPASGPASRPNPDTRPGDTTTGGARRGASPINQPMADPQGRVRRPGPTGLEPGSSTQSIPGVVGSGLPAGEANGGGGTIGQPSTGAGTIRLRPRAPASGASAP